MSDQNNTAPELSTGDAQASVIRAIFLRSQRKHKTQKGTLRRSQPVATTYERLGTATEKRGSRKG